MLEKKLYFQKLKASTLRLLTSKENVSFTYNSVFKESGVYKHFGRNNGLGSIDRLVELLFENSALPAAEKLKMTKFLSSEILLEDFLWFLIFFTTGWLYAPRHEGERSEISIDGFQWGVSSSFWAVRPDVKNSYFLDLLRSATLRFLTHIIRNRFEKEKIKAPELKTKMISMVLLGTIQQFYSALPSSRFLERIDKKNRSLKTADLNSESENEEIGKKDSTVLKHAAEELFDIYWLSGKAIRKILGKKNCRPIVKQKHRNFITACIKEALERNAFNFSLDVAGIEIPEDWQG
ncbi:MAG: hypothetical protein PHV05_03070 [Candidatus Riflebacteria bacterium]|nr:hypothetical protein [Candidatus Riflebacteria bacterium]